MNGHNTECQEKMNKVLAHVEDILRERDMVEADLRAARADAEAGWAHAASVAAELEDILRLRLTEDYPAYEAQAENALSMYRSALAARKVEP